LWVFFSICLRFLSVFLRSSATLPFSPARPKWLLYGPWRIEAGRISKLPRLFTPRLANERIPPIGPRLCPRSPPHLRKLPRRESESSKNHYRSPHP
jgi:hypothetical protein